MAEQEAFPRNWLVMEDFFYPALDRDGKEIRHATRTEGVAGLSNQIEETTKAMRHSWRGEIVQFDTRKQVVRSEGPSQKMTPSGEPELEPDGAGGHRYVFERTNELNKKGQRMLKMVDIGVTMFKPLTDEEATRFLTMPTLRRLEQKLYYDEHPLEWTLPEGRELAANGVEASTAAAMSAETLSELKDKEAEIKKLKADLARAKKNEKLVSGRLASEMKQLATASSNRQLPTRDS